MSKKEQIIIYSLFVAIMSGMCLLNLPNITVAVAACILFLMMQMRLNGTAELEFERLERVIKDRREDSYQWEERCREAWNQLSALQSQQSSKSAAISEPPKKKTKKSKKQPQSRFNKLGTVLIDTEAKEDPTKE